MRSLTTKAATTTLVVSTLFFIATLTINARQDQNNARQDPRLDASAIITKSIAALGGVEKLRELERVYTKLHALVEGVEVDEESWSEIPGRSKQIIRFEQQGKKMELVMVFDGDQGWLKATGAVTKELMGDEKLEDSYMQRNLVRRLYPLLDDSKYKLALLGEVSVDDCATYRIEVSLAPKIQFELFFDAKTSLLRKYSAKATGGQLKGMIVEQYFSNYKDFDGLKYAVDAITKIDGEMYCKDQVIELRRLKELPKGTFSKP